MYAIRSYYVLVSDVLAALRGPREVMAGDPALAGVVGDVVGELAEAEAKGAA